MLFVTFVVKFGLFTWRGICLLFRFKEEMFMEKLTERYPVVIEIPVAWGEMDAFQHLNNIVYFRYFESARIAYFERQVPPI